MHMATTTHKAQLRNSNSSATTDVDMPVLTKDTAFQLVSNWRRREVLRYLNEHGGETSVGELAEHIASKKEDVPVGQITSKQRKRVYVGLYQCHLKQLAEEGVIDYNKNRGTVHVLPLADELTPYLDDEPQKYRSLSRRTLIGFIGGIVLASVAVATLSLYHSMTLPLALWGSLSTMGFLFVSARWVFTQ